MLICEISASELGRRSTKSAFCWSGTPPRGPQRVVGDAGVVSEVLLRAESPEHQGVAVRGLPGLHPHLGVGRQQRLLLVPANLEEPGGENGQLQEDCVVQYSRYSRTPICRADVGEDVRRGGKKSLSTTSAKLETLKQC